MQASCIPVRFPFLVRQADCGLKMGGRRRRRHEEAVDRVLPQTAGVKPQTALWRREYLASTPRSSARSSACAVWKIRNARKPSSCWISTRPLWAWPENACHAEGEKGLNGPFFHGAAGSAGGTSGRMKRKVQPWPSPSDSTQMRPPWRSTMRRHSARPTPVPS